LAQKSRYLPKNANFLDYFAIMHIFSTAKGKKMTDKTQPKRVLITGCSSGFGLLTAVAVAKAGFDCIATMRNLNKAHYLEEALKQASATATIDRLDVTDAVCIKQIAEKYVPIDILINNAGILIMASALDMTEDEMRKIFETNYFGAVALTRAVVPGMIENHSGLIINVASLAGLIGHMFNASYSASKHALIGFTKSIRPELKPFNIKVVSVEPGYHKTEIIHANANLYENFYDKTSPLFEYNRGFLRLMLNKIVPRAIDPKPHYIIGKNATFATTAQWLGLTGLLEKFALRKLDDATNRENKRAEAKKSAGKKQTSNI